jgi:hypothetical protein
MKKHHTAVTVLEEHPHNEDLLAAILMPVKSFNWLREARADIGYPSKLYGRP